MPLTIKHIRILNIAIVITVVLGGVITYAWARQSNQPESTSEVKDAQTAEQQKTKPDEAASPEATISDLPKKNDSVAKKPTPSSNSIPGTAPSNSPVHSTPPDGGTGGACAVKPIAANTGSSGVLTADGRTILNTPNEIIQNVSFASGIEIRADGVQLKNVNVNGGILLNEADGVLLDHISAISVSVSSASNTTIQYAHVTAFEDDSFHVTSDGSKHINNFTLKYSYIDRPGFNPGSLSHWDGVQVRGAYNVTIFCNNFDVGPWQDPYNVLIYFEQANGGNDRLLVDNNWLNGANFAIMTSLPDLPINFSIINNKLSSNDFHFGYCYLGDGFTPAYLASIVQSGNLLDGAPMAQVCKESDI